MGQNTISVEHNTAGGETFIQRGEQNPQRSTTYFPFTDIYTSVAFFLILPFFLARKAKSKCRESHFHGSHMNAVLSNSGLLLQRATLPGGSRQFRQCQLPTYVTSSASLTWRWESKPDLFTMLISHKTSWNFWRLSTSLLQPKILSTTGLGHFHPSQGQSKNYFIDMKVSGNFTIRTIKSPQKRKLHK